MLKAVALNEFVSQYFPPTQTTNPPILSFPTHFVAICVASEAELSWTMRVDIVCQVINRSGWFVRPLYRLTPEKGNKRLRG